MMYKFDIPIRLPPHLIYYYFRVRNNVATTTLSPGMQESDDDIVVYNPLLFLRPNETVRV